VDLQPPEGGDGRAPSMVGRRASDWVNASWARPEWATQQSIKGTSPHWSYFCSLEPPAPPPSGWCAGGVHEVDMWVLPWGDGIDRWTPCPADLIAEPNTPRSRLDLASERHIVKSATLWWLLTAPSTAHPRPHPRTSAELCPKAGGASGGLPAAAVITGRADRCSRLCPSISDAATIAKPI
jgi:hypothetical protein